ncbi:hypothetical protein CNMCM7691_006137 [Aspergillus felis]|uniref:Uncharacterized protein n=1 Tax=Aspergillus felis TaxID=1287682 RepID=A0A8H6R5F7_9EURO|nr:hypothetical protein CNMCM7691_006137 [Aspergillus felis]
MNPSTKETVVINFEVQGPVDPSNPASEMLYRVTIFGAFANGTTYSYTVEAENVKITEREDKSMRVDFFGGNEFGWSGSSLLKPRPVYIATLNAPEVGIRGSITLHGNTVAPHYSCGSDAAGVDEQIITGIGWANALPDANATVSLQIRDTSMIFEGYGYHDKTWVDRPFGDALQSAFWGHARLGPYAVVWWHSRAQDGAVLVQNILLRGRMDMSSRLIALTTLTTLSAGETVRYGPFFLEPQHRGACSCTGILEMPVLLWRT